VALPDGIPASHSPGVLWGYSGYSGVRLGPAGRSEPQGSPPVNQSTAGRLYRIGYTSDLYGVPWFLTLFSHILPLDKAPARPPVFSPHARTGLQDCRLTGWFA
jgi:hypothetical protein